MARLARNSNTAVMFEGTNVTEVSADLIAAIQHANTILGWFENLPEEELPKDWMWPFPDLLEEHFKWVKEERAAKYGTGDGGSSDDEYSHMESNEWRPGDD